MNIIDPDNYSPLVDCIDVIHVLTQCECNVITAVSSLCLWLTCLIYSFIYNLITASCRKNTASIIQLFKLLLLYQHPTSVIVFQFMLPHNFLLAHIFIQQRNYILLATYKILNVRSPSQRLQMNVWLQLLVDCEAGFEDIERWIQMNEAVLLIPSASTGALTSTEAVWPICLLKAITLCF